MNERRLCLHQHIVTLKGRRFIPGYYYTVNRGSLIFLIVLSSKQARSGTVIDAFNALSCTEGHVGWRHFVLLFCDDKKCSLLHIYGKLVRFSLPWPGLLFGLYYFYFIVQYFYPVYKHEWCACWGLLLEACPNKFSWQCYTDTPNEKNTLISFMLLPNLTTLK